MARGGLEDELRSWEMAVVWRPTSLPSPPVQLGGRTKRWDVKKAKLVVSASSSLGVVITGGSKGLGFALAREFLAADGRVVVCGRDQNRLESATVALQAEFQDGHISGMVCDVSNPHNVADFAAFAAQKLGIIHLWLNNAGEVTGKRLLADLEAEEIIRVTNTNVLGSLLCCREAILLMRRQPQSQAPAYHIFNMGFSKWGAAFTKSAATHKSTKVALSQLTQSLSTELQEAGISSIGVHNLSPGMVLTDLLLKDSTPLARRFFNTLAEEPETVAAALAPQIQAVQGTGQSIDFLSPPAAFLRVLGGVPQILAGGRFFDKEGNRVRLQGCRYQENGVKMLYHVPSKESE